MPPRIASDLRADRPNRLEACDRIGRMLGLPHLWGWQRHALALITEVDDDGGWSRHLALIRVCRQTGKSALLTVRCALGVLRGERVGIAAQLREVAVDIWADVSDLIEQLYPAPSARRKVKSVGRELIECHPTGGSLKVVTAHTRAARSRTLDTLVIDEGNFVPREFLTALKPTRITRPHSQIILASSHGEDAGGAFDAVFDGLEDGAIDEDVADPRDPDKIAVIGWGADADDDHGAYEVWQAAIPTLDMPGGVSSEILLEDWHDPSMTPVEFAREYLSVAPASGQRVVGEKHWAAIAGTAPRSSVDVAVGVHVSPHSETASIVVAWRDGDRIAVALDSDGTGQAWLPRALLEAARRWRPRQIVVDSISPARDLAGVVERIAADWRPLGTADVSAACSLFARLAASDPPGLIVESAQPLDAAAKSARRRPVGRGWMMRPKSGKAHVEPFVAAALAVHAVDTMPPSSSVTVHRFSDHPDDPQLPLDTDARS